MSRSAARPLTLLLALAGFSMAVTAPAQAFTPPIGSDKGSIVKDIDASSPPLVRSEHGGSPDANGIIAILIG